jgi:hypothetical protein
MLQKIEVKVKARRKKIKDKSRKTKDRKSRG